VFYRLLRENYGIILEDAKKLEKVHILGNGIERKLVRSRASALEPSTEALERILT
jgi:hypothetical protein